LTYCTSFTKCGRGQAVSPFGIACISVLPAFIILSTLQFLLVGFYYDSGDPEAMQTMMNAYQNDTAASYLSVVGVVYSLVVAHMLAITNSKQEVRNGTGDERMEEALCIARFVGRAEPSLFTSSALSFVDAAASSVHTVFVQASNDLFSGEIANVRTIVQMLKTIRTTDRSMLREKVGAVKMVMAYLNLLHLNWGSMDSESADNATDVIYGVLPFVERICSMHQNEFYTNLGDRIIDTTNDVAVANAKRFSIQAYAIPTMLWVLHLVISTSMFFGVTLIYTGASAFNFVLCGSAATLMGVAAYAIADLDDPFEGYIRLHGTCLNALRKYVEGVLADESRLMEDIAAQSFNTRQGLELLVQSQKNEFKAVVKKQRPVSKFGSVGSQRTIQIVVKGKYSEP